MADGWWITGQTGPAVLVDDRSDYVIRGDMDIPRDQDVLAKTITYWIEPDDGMFSLSHAETKRRLVRGLWELAQTCGITFHERATAHGSMVRISFHPASEMIDATVDGEGTPLALAWGDGDLKGQIWILNEQTEQGNGLLDLTVNRNRIVESMIMYKFLVTENGTRSDDQSSIMSASAEAVYLSPADVLELQAKYGPPKNPFGVVTKQLLSVSVRLAELTYSETRLSIADEMPDLKFTRATGETKEIRQNAHKKILALWDNQGLAAGRTKSRADAWHALSKQWANVPGAL